MRRTWGCSSRRRRRPQAFFNGLRRYRNQEGPVVDAVGATVIRAASASRSCQPTQPLFHSVNGGSSPQRFSTKGMVYEAVGATIRRGREPLRRMVGR